MICSSSPDNKRGACNLYKPDSLGSYGVIPIQAASWDSGVTFPPLAQPHPLIPNLTNISSFDLAERITLAFIIFSNERRSHKLLSVSSLVQFFPGILLAALVHINDGFLK